MGLGEKLKNLRLSKKMSIGEVADAVKLSKSAITNYESNFRTPDTKTLVLFSDLFKVSLDYLAGRTDLPDGPDTIKFLDDEDVSFEDFENLSDEDKRAIVKYIKVLRDSNIN